MMNFRRRIFHFRKSSMGHKNMLVDSLGDINPDEMEERRLFWSGLVSHPKRSPGKLERGLDSGRE